MKMLKKCITILLTLTLIFSICACSKQNSEIQTLTKKFEHSCNSLDFNAMLDCVDPTVSNSVKTVTGFIGMFSDNDTDELLDKLAQTVFDGLPENSQEFFSSIKIDIDNIEVSENNASAAAEITYDISGEKNKTNATFEYLCVDGQWYISNLGLE